MRLKIGVGIIKKFIKMKKIILSLGIICLTTSCASIMGYSEKDVIKTASVEQNCPISDIKVVDKIKRAGNSTYYLEVCGIRKVYKTVGSVIMEAEKAENMTKQ